jgi:MYXO-CTERM domain-containing protein
MVGIVRAAVVVAAALLLGGCGGASPPATVTMVDAFDGDAFGAHVEELHGSYVAGSTFAITVSAPDGRSEGWTLSSSDPDVIRVEAPLVRGSAFVAAGRAGEATLRVVDGSGMVEAARSVTVAVPDRVGLYSAGMQMTGASDDAAHVTRVKLVAGGDASFLVRYFRQGTELLGNHALGATSTTVEAARTSMSLAPARDFVRLAATTAGRSGSVSLLAGGVVTEIPLSTVDRSAVAHVTLIPAATEHAAKGASLPLFAHAVDDTSGDVYGAPFDWSVGGSHVSGRSELGDVLFTAADEQATATVAASHASLSPDTIHASMTEANRGCAVSSTTTSATWMAPLGLALLGLAISRAQRRDAPA